MNFIQARWCLGRVFVVEAVDDMVWCVGDGRRGKGEGLDEGGEIEDGGGARMADVVDFGAAERVVEEEGQAPCNIGSVAEAAGL